MKWISVKDELPKVEESFEEYNGLRGEQINVVLVLVVAEKPWT